MGSSSKALQSSWVKRLRPREIEGTWAASPGEEEEGEEKSSSKSSSISRPVIHPHLFPKVENVFDEPVKRLRVSPSPSVDSKDLVTDTHVVASFGPFQVRARSLVPVKEKKQQQQAEMGRAGALVPADQWKQYSQGKEKEVATEQNPSATAWSRRMMIKPCSEEDEQEYRGGLLGSEIASSYWSKSKEVTNDYRNKHPNPNSNLTLGPDSDQLRSNTQKLCQFQWKWPEEKMWNNPGFGKEIVPSFGKHVISDNHKMDRIGCELRAETRPPFANAFHSNSVNAATGFCGFGQYATQSDLPSHFTVLKQMQIPENCSNHCFIDKDAIWKPEAFQNVKVNPLEPGTSRRGHCHGPTPMLGSHRCGIGQGFGRPDSMEKYPFHRPNYPCLGHQKDQIILSDSSSTASFSSDVHADLLNRTDDRKISSEPHVHLGPGTSFRERDAACYGPTREKGYLEPESNSSHQSNCPGLDQEYNSTRPENKESRLLKQFNKARDGWSEVKGKGSNFENQLTEQRHVIGSDTGSAFRYTSYDNDIHQNDQENYTVGVSRRSDLQGVFPLLAPEVQPVAFHFSSIEEEEIDSGRDGNEKGCLTKDKKISTMVQCVLPGKESPRDNISFCTGKTILDTREFHQFKSRKQSAEEGPSFQRLHSLIKDREAELDCNRHVRLKLSAVNGQTSSSGKRICCTHEELGPTDAGIANNLAAISEANTVKGYRPQMWLQRWIHSSGRTDIVNDQVPGEKWNCNPVTKHGSLTRNCTQEGSGDNRKAGFVQWTKSRKEDSSYFSGSMSQAFGEGHFKSDLKGSQFMKKLLTSSASAMAILGTRTKEMYVAQPHRKDIFPVWASTQRADADAKVTGLEKEIKTTDELELNPKKMAFEKEIVEHQDIHV